MRVCPKARSDKAGFRGLREPTLGCLHPADPEPSLQSNLEVNMKMVKSLILGSAAGLLPMGGAQAAGLSAKGQTGEGVSDLSLYGSGFYFISGRATSMSATGS